VYPQLGFSFVTAPRSVRSGCNVLTFDTVQSDDSLIQLQDIYAPLKYLLSGVVNDL